MSKTVHIQVVGFLSFVNLWAVNFSHNLKKMFSNTRLLADFTGHSIFQKSMCGDKQTVFNFAGTGTTKFSGGLFCVECGWWRTDCFEFCGNWHYKIFGRIVLSGMRVVTYRLFSISRELALQNFREDCLRPYIFWGEE